MRLRSCRGEASSPPVSLKNLRRAASSTSGRSAAAAAAAVGARVPAASAPARADGGPPSIWRARRQLAAADEPEPGTRGRRPNVPPSSHSAGWCVLFSRELGAAGEAAPRVRPAAPQRRPVGQSSLDALRREVKSQIGEIGELQASQREAKLGRRRKAAESARAERDAAKRPRARRRRANARNGRQRSSR